MKAREYNWKTAFWPGVEGLGSIAVALLITPLFLKILGTEGFGYWALLNAIAALFGFFTTGYSEIYLTADGALPGTEAKDQSSGLILQFLTATVIGLILLPVKICFHSIQTDLIAAIVLATIRPMELLWLAPFRKKHQVRQATFWSLSSKIFGFSLQIIGFLTFHSLAIGFALHSFFILAMIVITVRPQPCSIAEATHFFRSHQPVLLRFWFQNGLNLAFQNIDKIIVGSLLGLNSLAIYSVGQLMVTQIQNLFATTFQQLTPTLARKDLDPSKRHQIYWQNNILVLILFLCFATVASFDDYLLIRKWSHLSLPDLAQIPHFIALAFASVINVVPYYGLIAKREIGILNRITFYHSGVAILATSIFLFTQSIGDFLLVRAALALVASTLIHWTNNRTEAKWAH